MPAEPKPVKLLGPAKWVESGSCADCRIRRVILRDADTLVVEIESGAYRYLFNLERQHGEYFAGTCTCEHNGKTYTDRASCSLYPSSSGYFLFGTWTEEGSDYVWWADLNTVDRFPDEVEQN